MEKLQILPKIKNDNEYLNKLISILDVNLSNIKSALWNICIILYEIDKKKLYILDDCRSIRAFVEKRIKTGQWQITASSVKNYLALMKDLDNQNLLEDKDILEISPAKLYDLHRFRVKGKKQLLEYKNKTIREIRNIFKDTSTGRFISKEKDIFKRRKNTVMRNFMVEVPESKESLFESGFVKLCNKYDARLP